MSFKDAAALLDLGRERLHRYFYNQAVPAKNKRKRKVKKQVVALTDATCTALERDIDIACSFDAWSAASDNAKLVTKKIHPQVSYPADRKPAPTASNLSESTSCLKPIVTVNLGDCGSHPGLYVSILSFGSQLPDDTPQHAMSKWQYTTVMTGSNRTTVTINPDVKGRITFSRGLLQNQTYEWSITMDTSTGFPLYGAILIAADGWGLELRTVVAKR